VAVGLRIRPATVVWPTLRAALLKVAAVNYCQRSRCKLVHPPPRQSNGQLPQSLLTLWTGIQPFPSCEASWTSLRGYNGHQVRGQKYREPRRMLDLFVEDCKCQVVGPANCHIADLRIAAHPRYSDDRTTFIALASMGSAGRLTGRGGQRYRISPMLAGGCRRAHRSGAQVLRNAEFYPGPFEELRYDRSRCHGHPLGLLVSTILTCRIMGSP